MQREFESAATLPVRACKGGLLCLLLVTQIDAKDSALTAGSQWVWSRQGQDHPCLGAKGM